PARPADGGVAGARAGARDLGRARPAGAGGAAERARGSEPGRRAGRVGRRAPALVPAAERGAGPAPRARVPAGEPGRAAAPGYFLTPEVQQSSDILAGLRSLSRQRPGFPSAG